MKVLGGEVGRNVFPRPVHEEGPFDQREKVLQAQAKQFALNLTRIDPASGENISFASADPVKDVFLIKIRKSTYRKIG